MRTGAVAATLCAAALLAVAPASARVREVGGSITATGGLTISWHGDVARGPGYSGRRSAGFTLKLRRVVVRATYTQPPGTFRVAPGR